MILARSIAIFFIASCTILTVAKAQNVYRCGNSYSQSPCPGGVAIDASDSRTQDQKVQADTDTLRDRQAANALEKERLKQEAAAAPQKAGAAKASTAAAAPRPHGKKKLKEPAYFTARTAGDQKAAKKKSAAAP